MLRLYDYADSGNCYKIRLLCAQLGIPYQKISVDIGRPETMTEVVKMNPNRRVPILILEDGRSLFESNAIACYLAEGTPLYAEDRVERAQILHWLFFEQNSHEPNIATVRSWVRLDRLGRHDPAVAAAKRELGHFALRVMEEHLDGRRFFVAERYTVADVGLYAYTHVAPEGGFSLEGYPNVRAWLARIAAQPKHIRITD